MTGLSRLLRTTAFRFSLIYLGLFAAASAAAVGYIYYKTNTLLTEQLEEAVRAEFDSLNERYARSGLDGLQRAIAERSAAPGNGLYLLANAEGRHLAGNLKAVSEELWNSTGGVVFFYRRAYDEKIENRLAFAVILRLANGYRLVVGRDIEDQRQFGEVVRSAFLWTLAGMIIVGLGGGILIGRSLLRRIEIMTHATRKIMAGDLTGRIPLAGTDDEFDRLATGLNAMLSRIEELIAGFREVSDNIAHDLRTPLNRLRNRIEAALRDGNAARDHHDVLRATIEDADELIKTFNAVLSIARLEAGAAQSANERFDLAAVVNDVAELYEPVADERGLTLTIQAAEQTLMEGKRELVAQAVANILDNAIKYGVPDQNSLHNGVPSNVLVRLVPQSETAQILIADHGPGIPPGDRKRVFNRFVRLEASRSLPGSGLGLSLAAAVARLHGGNLALDDNHPGLAATLSLQRWGGEPDNPA